MKCPDGGMQMNEAGHMKVPEETKACRHLFSVSVSHVRAHVLRVLRLEREWEREKEGEVGGGGAMKLTV